MESFWLFVDCCISLPIAAKLVSQVPWTDLLYMRDPLLSASTVTTCAPGGTMADHSAPLPRALLILHDACIEEILCAQMKN